MAHPKRQHSTQRSRKRRTGDALTTHVGEKQAQGTQMGFNHRVDPITGYYKGKKVLDVEPRVKKGKAE